MSRYEIREQEPTLLQQRYGVARTVYVVWDTELDMRVPFGSYRTRMHANDRLRRLRAKEAERS